MVVVEVREERVGHVDRAMAALDQPVMRARTVIPDDEIAADFDEISGALPRQRRRGRAGAEQRDGQRSRRFRCGAGACAWSAAAANRRGGERGDEVSAFHDNLEAGITSPTVAATNIFASLSCTRVHGFYYAA